MQMPKGRKSCWRCRALNASRIVLARNLHIALQFLDVVAICLQNLQKKMLLKLQPDLVFCSTGQEDARRKRLVAAAAAYVAIHMKGSATVELKTDEVSLGLKEFEFREMPTSSLSLENAKSQKCWAPSRCFRVLRIVTSIGSNGIESAGDDGRYSEAWVSISCLIWQVRKMSPQETTGFGLVFLLPIGFFRYPVLLTHTRLISFRSFHESVPFWVVPKEIKELISDFWHTI